MTSTEEALKWIHETKVAAQRWPFGSNPRAVRSNIAKNRDAKGIADSFSYQVDMAVQQVDSRLQKMDVREEYENLQEVLDKQRECLKVINQVAKMEDLFSTLLADVESTALQLSTKSQSTLDADACPQKTFNTQALAENCIKSLQESWSYLQSLAQCNQVHLQNAAHYHQFWHEVGESNEWLQYQLSQLPHLFPRKQPVAGSSQQIKRTMADMMNILKDYLQWQTRLDILFEKAKHIVPLKARTEKMENCRQAQVLVDYKTEEFELQAGQVVILTDNSNLKQWKVKVDDDSAEMTVPAIIILIPPTDLAALDAAFKLRLQMLAMWSSTTKLLGGHVTRVLLEVFKDWEDNSKSEYKGMSDEQKSDLVKTLNYMGDTLGCSLRASPAYQSLVAKTKDIMRSTQQKKCTQEGDNHKVTLVVQVNYLQKFLQRYWDFWTYCDAYRSVLEQLRQPKQLFIHDNSTQMRYITTFHFVKFWERDLEDPSHWSVEEETITADQTDALESNNNLSEEEEFFESGTTELKTETEEMIEAEMEVETTFVITGIVSNPGEDGENIISLQDAIDRGIIDPENGLYVNKSTHTSMAITQAMNEGFIKMGPKETKKSEEKVKSAGIITVRTTRETRPYSVKQALDTNTNEMVSASVAFERGILEPDYGTYKDLAKGTVMLVGDAVKHRLVDIEYEANNNSMVLEEVSKTYLVQAVKCQRSRQMLPFHEAVQKGMIEKDSGAYMDNVTGERMFIVEAISKGFVEATESDELPSVSVAELSSAAVNGKKTFNPLLAMKAGIINENGYM